MCAAGFGDMAAPFVIFINDVDDEIVSNISKRFGLYETYARINLCKDMVTEEDTDIITEKKPKTNV